MMEMKTEFLSRYVNPDRDSTWWAFTNRTHHSRRRDLEGNILAGEKVEESLLIEKTVGVFLPKVPRSFVE